MLIFNKDTQIVLLVGLRVAQADPLAILMVSAYKFEIPGRAYLDCLHSYRRGSGPLGSCFSSPS